MSRETHPSPDPGRVGASRSTDLTPVESEKVRKAFEADNWRGGFHHLPLAINSMLAARNLRQGG